MKFGNKVLLNLNMEEVTSSNQQINVHRIYWWNLYSTPIEPPFPH
jgi:hypothetical protein